MSRLIIGIGNPGKEYSQTRHNLGYLVLDKLIGQNTLKFGKEPGVEGLVAYGKIGSQQCRFLKPTTYVNHSGIAVRQMCAKFDIAAADLLVVCDDLSLDFGQIRIRARGTSGGHNGLRSVIHELGTKEFARLRLGIGGADSKEATVDYVLSGFTSKEKKELNEFVQQAALGCTSWLSEGVAKAMDQFNKRSPLDT